MRQPFFGYPESGGSGVWRDYQLRVWQNGEITVAPSRHAKYMKLGDLIVVNVWAELLSAGTANTNIFFTVPFPGPVRRAITADVAPGTALGQFMYSRVGVVLPYVGTVIQPHGNTTAALPTTSPGSGAWVWMVRDNNNGLLGTNTNFAVASGNQLTASLCYPRGPNY